MNLRRRAYACAPLPQAPRAVCFDMDGLMLDSERALLDCWRETAQAHGAAVDDGLWLAMVGLHDAACRSLLHEALGAAAGDALRAEAEARYAQRVAAGLPLKPGVFALLDLLAACGIPRAVVTSTRRDRALVKLQTAELLPRFSAVVAGGDVALPKPAPDPYLLAAERLGVAPQHCLVLEDSAPGVRAALAAGMTAIQVPDLVVPDAATRALGHRVVDSLHDAHALLAAVLRVEQA